MKKVVLLCLALLLILTLPACGRRNQTPSEPSASEPGSVVTPDGQSTQPSEEASVPAEKPAEAPAAEPAPDETPAAEPEKPSEDPSAEPGPEEPEASVPVPDEDGWYYDLENVTAYLMAYGKLPSNYITKKQAEDLGWSGGSVQRFKEGAAIGGGRFGNYEGLLPDGNYTECDIDTDGASSRGAKRLVFSSDGRYFYTDDHYETFAEVTFVDGRMVLDYDY